MNENELNAQLEIAISKGNIESISSLIEKGADVHANNDYALILAVECGDIKVINYLMQYGFDINMRSGTLINIAVKKNHLDLITEWYKKDVLKKIDKTHVLTIAIEEGKEKTVELLMSYGVLPTTNNLVKAIEYKNITLFQRLLSNCLKRKVSIDYSSLLYTAIQMKNMTIVSIVSENSNVILDERNNPIAAACYANSLEIIEFLIKLA